MKKPLQYDITYKKQGQQECVQTCASLLLNYYGVKKDSSEIKEEVPIYTTSKGEPIGSSIGHIASYFLKCGFDTTMHINDLLIFDRTWDGFSSQEILKKLDKRKKFIQHPVYKKDEFNMIFDGYSQFIKKGGSLDFSVITNDYLYSLLLNGPIFTVVNYQFLHSSAKTIYNKKDKSFDEDPIRGYASTHVVITAGYENNHYTIIDPDIKRGGTHQIRTDHLLGAFYLAQIDMDNILITLKSN